MPSLEPGVTTQVSFNERFALTAGRIYVVEQINLKPLRGYVQDAAVIDNGMDLSEFYLSIEWDVVIVSELAFRNGSRCDHLAIRFRRREMP